MVGLPSRDELLRLLADVRRIVPVRAIGFVQPHDGKRLSILSVLPQGITVHVVLPSELAAILLPQSGPWSYADEPWLRQRSDQPLEWQLDLAGVQGLVSLPCSESPARRFFVGLPEDRRPNDGEGLALEHLARAGAELLERPVPPEVVDSQLRRLEIVAGLLPALRNVLDVREVFDQLSTIGRAALPHDMLALGLFNDDLTTMTVYASTEEGSDVGRVFPQPYPIAVTRSWDFDIIDDRAAYALERD